MATPTNTTVGNVKWGPASTLGLLLTLVPLIGSIYAAIKGNDTATVTAGAGAALVALTTIGGRMAQAIAAARSAATLAGPWIDALQAALASSPPGAQPQTVVVNAAPNADTANVAVDREGEAKPLVDPEADLLEASELPTDDEEFADTGVPEPDTAVHPDVPR